jgi:hypothetical protein
MPEKGDYSLDQAYKGCLLENAAFCGRFFRPKGFLGPARLSSNNAEKQKASWGFRSENPQLACSFLRVSKLNIRTFLLYQKPQWSFVRRLESGFKNKVVLLLLGSQLEPAQSRTATQQTSQRFGDRSTMQRVDNRP